MWILKRMLIMTKNMNKLVDNGKVAVLYSPGFGAGWSTWNKEVPELVFDPAIVKFVETEQWAEMETYVTLKYPGLYTGGMKDLAVAWLPEGTEFRIGEYDGAENIEIKDNTDWITA
jgi:hypothetical protein